jgi:enoyl-CoA hydratase
VTELVQIMTAGHVRVITMNRPDARNALSGELIGALYSAQVAADADDEVSAVVLTGADPAFCAGVDLKEFARDRDAYLANFDSGDCIRYVGEMTKPVIGAVNGPTFTGGLEMALGCDFLIASERAVFGDTHLRVGALPGGGMTARLSRRVGSAQARRMSLTGDPIGADEAFRIGLVTEVVPHEQLLSRALEIAGSIAEAELRLITALKRQYSEGDAATLRYALDREREIAFETAIAYERLDQRRREVVQRNHERRSKEG